MVKLYEYSPAWALDGEAVVGFDLAVTHVLGFQGPDPLTWTAERQSGHSAAVGRALKRLPEGAVLRVYRHARPTTSTEAEQMAGCMRGSPVADAIRTERAQHLAAGQHVEQTLAVSTPGRGGPRSLTTRALGRRMPALRKGALSFRTELLGQGRSYRDTLVAGLEAAGVAARPLVGDALFRTLRRLSLPWQERPGIYNPADTLRSQLFAQSGVLASDHLRMSGRRCRILTFAAPPQRVGSDTSRVLGDLPFPHLLCVSVRRVPNEEAKRRVHGARRYGHDWNALLAKVRGSETNEELPDHEVLRQQADSDALLEALTGEDVLCDVTVQLAIWAEDPRELESRTELCLQRLAACGDALGAADDLLHHVAFVGMQPGAHGVQTNRAHAMLGSRAADLLPLESEWRGWERPTYVARTRRGQPFGFAPFPGELRAWNAAFAGSAGSGKSFATRLMLSGWLASGGQVVVVTRGTDYDDFAAAFDGEVRRVDAEAQGLSLAPPSGAPPATLNALLGVLLQEDGQLSRSEKRLVQAATEAACPEGSFLEAWCRALQGADEPALARELQARMRFWLDGPMGAALTREQDTSRRMEVWDLAEVPDDDTQGVVLALIAGRIAGRIAQAPTIVVMDEVWALLGTPAGAELVENLYRTVRKRGSSIWSISQSMNDFARLPVGCRSAILNNSEFKVFLKHDSSEVQALAAAFRLNPREAQLLTELESRPGEMSEMLFGAGERRTVLQLTPTPTEYWLATSHPRDAAWMLRAVEASPGAPVSEHVRKLARLLPRGAVACA